MTERLPCTLHRVCVIFLTLTPNLVKALLHINLIMQIFFSLKKMGSESLRDLSKVRQKIEMTQLKLYQGL